MFALPIFMPRYENINFYQYIPKIKLFLQKNAKCFVCWGLFPQAPVPLAAGCFARRPPAPGGWRLRPQAPKTSSPLRISGYALDVFIAAMLFCVN